MADSGGATFDPAVLARLRGLPRGQLVTLLRGLSEAELRTLHESWAIWALPGQREPAGDWQVWLIRAGRGFGKTRAGAEWVPVRGSSGRIIGAADALIGTTRIAAFETPGLEDAPLAAPRLSVAATGTGAGWRHAALLYSLDDGASWIAAGASAAPATIGTIAVVAGPAPATLTDRAGAFEVMLVRGDMSLADADAAALDAGANLAMAGAS